MLSLTAIVSIGSSFLFRLFPLSEQLDIDVASVSAFLYMKALILLAIGIDRFATKIAPLFDAS